MKQVSIDRTLVAISVVSVLYFSYIPFLFLINALGLEKVYVFLGLIFSAAYLAVLKIVLWGHYPRFDIHALLAVSLYILFALYSVVRYLSDSGDAGALLTIRTIAVVNVVFVVLAMLCRAHKGLVIKIIFFLSLIYFLFLVHSLLLDTSGNNESLRNIFSGQGIEGVFYQNINNYLGLFIISNIYFILSGSRFKVFSQLAGLGALFGMLMVGGRSSFLAILVVLACYAYRESRQSLKAIKTKHKLILLIPVAATLIALFGGQLLEAVRHSIMFSRLYSLTDGGDPSLRIFLFSKAIELFLRDEWTLLFGAGINSFPVYVGAEGQGMYPHNLFLELLAEYGIVGFGFFVVSIIYALRIRKRKLGALYGASNEDKVVYLLALYFLLISLFTGGLQSSWVFMFFVFLLLPSSGVNSLSGHEGYSAKRAGHEGRKRGQGTVPLPVNRSIQN